MTQPTVLPREIPSAVSNDEAIELAYLSRDRKVLEMGSHYGFSTIVIAQNAKEFHSVDWHQGDSMAGRGDNLVVYRMNLMRHGQHNRVVSHVGRFESVLPTMAAEQFDMVFLDGEHDHASVERDLQLALRVLKPGGIIAFHDYGRFEVQPVVDDWAEDIGQDVRVVDSLAIVFKGHEPRVMPFHALREEYGLRGVIHVGINTGQEIPWYLNAGYAPLMVFEPHPDAFNKLVADYGDSVSFCVNVALGAKTGELDLLVPADGNTERCSKYQPIATPGHDWTEVPNTSMVIVPQWRYDEWVVTAGIDTSFYNVFVLDVQGMELEVLQGMGDELCKFEVLEIECSERPVYKGEAPAQRVIQYLHANGFDQASDVAEHDDVLFVRRRM